jgi:glutathione peroxidase
MYKHRRIKMMKHIEIKKILVIMAIMLLAGGINMVYSTQLYDINVQKTDGSEIKLESYKGKVLLIVNTASKCGFTKQYDDLQALYDRFGKDGFVVLGFPANNFMNRGKKIHPLYKYLTEKSSNPKHSGKISWNFNKFLIGRNGEILDRYSSATNPQDKDVIAAIEKALK